MTITVGLLRMDDLPESALHVLGDYPSLYEHLFRDTATTLLDIAVHRGDTPSTLDDAVSFVSGEMKKRIG